ncbi:MAG: LysM domain-containing protein [Tetrasphaera sp.]
MKWRHLLLGGLGVIAVVLTLCAAQVAATIADSAHADPASVVQQASLLLALASSDAFVVAVAVTSARLLRGQPAPWREPRPGPRRLVAYVATGLVGLTAASTSSSAAADRPGVGVSLATRGGSPQTAPDPLWQPTASPPDAAAPTRQPEIRLVGGHTRQTADSDLTTIVVRRGDCLWDIVARALGPHATWVEIDRAWPHWYAANRDVIGADPDLLRPGQQLQAPGGAGS